MTYDMITRLLGRINMTFQCNTWKIFVVLERDPIYMASQHRSVRINWLFDIHLNAIRKIFILSCFAIPMLLAGCTHDKTTPPDMDIRIVNSQEAIRYDQIALDTIFLSQPAPITDFFLRMQGDEYYLFDKRLCKLFVYDANGNFVDQHLGLGRGPGEVSKLRDHISHKGEHLIIDNVHVQVFDASWRFQKQLDFSWPMVHSIAELTSHPDPSYIDLYETKYYENRFASFSDSSLIFNIETTHPKYNAFNTKEYYQTSKIFGLYDINKQEIISVLGKKSPVYQKYSYIPNHDYHYYALANDTLFINFEPDPLIYVYDKTFSPIYAFGKPGRQMDQKYDETQNTEVIHDRNKFFIDRVTKGYYYHLSYFPGEKMLFRIYTTGMDKAIIDQVSEIIENPKRMQIYHGTTLIGDVEIPPRFRIIGYKAPYYYADGYDHYLDTESSHDRIGIYRFKL